MMIITEKENFYHLNRWKISIKNIFIVMQDIIDTLYESSKNEILNKIKAVLIKWNVFFQF